MIKKYPKTYFRVVLIEPEIPNNTGNIGRTCVGTYCELHLVGKLGFEINDKQLRRAGLDYWPHLAFHHHENWNAWWRLVEDPQRVHFFSKKAARTLYDAELREGDWLVFGRETKGLPESVLTEFQTQTVRLPQPGSVRSFNLACAVAVGVYEGLRQLNVK